MTKDLFTDGRSSPSLLRRMLREPLAGFALAAFAIFGLDILLSDAEPEREIIALSADAVQVILDNHAAMLGRSLTEAERDAQIRTLADQEVLVREAVKLGLYQHDPTTRKRLINQMHFLMAQNAPPPTSEDIAALRQANPERYLFPPTISFRHVFFETDETAARDLLQALQSGAALADDIGDRFWLGRDLEAYTAQQLLALFGFDFVSRIKQLTPGDWSGPLRSARGWHVVRVNAFNEASPLPEEELQRRLSEDWQSEFRRRTYDAQLAEMRRNYRIDVPVLPDQETSSLARAMASHTETGQ